MEESTVMENVFDFQFSTDMHILAIRDPKEHVYTKVYLSVYPSVAIVSSNCV